MNSELVAMGKQSVKKAARSAADTGDDSRQTGPESPSSGMPGTIPAAIPGVPGAGVDPSALSMPVAAKLLGLSEAALRRHVDQGLPVNPDGTLNLVTYAAWLNGTDDANHGD
ncbi:MAG: hypothetical protein JJU36_07085 [Phycisphaeraceae bacterium]|nr:hypothetical protein [Phycisphaeraceae bacterium]